MMISFLLILILFPVIIIYMQQTKFGRLPKSERLERILKSTHYKNGSFQNLHNTPVFAEDAHFFSVLYESIFAKKIRRSPIDKIPSIKTDLLHLQPNEDVLVWFGHSSYFLQIDGKKILVDPVFSNAASPLSFTVNAYKGTNIYTVDDMPEIDYLFISHDHWDHLDYETVIKLKSKVKKVICGLGTGEHFEYWGYDPKIIIEGDWNESVMIDPGFEIYWAPARHFSGRGFKRNQSLWSAFVFISPNSKIYIGGDGGYDTHFAEIGKKFGVFDLAILENGQYNLNWKYIHMQPEQVIQAAKDLNAKRLFPVHSSKFSLANHPWDEPLKRISECSKNSGISLMTPIIGEKVNLKDSTQQFTQWWLGVK